jgi:uncharacterized protein (DUF2126 family)
VSEIAASLALHDELLARRNVEIWVGAEPTFTRPDSLAPAWLAAAEGDDKLERATVVATELARALGGMHEKIVGRQFPDEPAPRFAFSVKWPAHALSVTPDPGVVEVNMAPEASVVAFAQQAEHIYSAARRAGLSATRHRFNGDVADSGGGGQISLGGPSPEASPFVRYPHVLPALIRYVNNHPSLSYWFASECVGSASQGPRPDEGTRERWDELALTLDWLETLADRGELPPDRLWEALGPLLVDASGNGHRAELNVEKLWSPHITPHASEPQGMRHGKMGIVELRAIRMPARPSMLAAAAALFRSIVARLIVSDYREDLIDWHDELHDRFALPSALERDLRHVLGDLDEHALGIPAVLRNELDAFRAPGIVCRLGDAILTLRPALEFWPLVGDVASQERAGARLVDASTARVEIVLEGGPDRIAINGRWAHPSGDLRAIGVRRRIYQPSPGLHPGLPTNDPLVVEWAWGGRVQRIELYAWQAGGGPYAGLPLDEGDALARRTDRIRITTRDGEVTADGHWPMQRGYTIDLRRAP